MGTNAATGQPEVSTCRPTGKNKKKKSHATHICSCSRRHHGPWCFGTCAQNGERGSPQDAVQRDSNMRTLGTAWLHAQPRNSLGVTQMWKVLGSRAAGDSTRRLHGLSQTNSSDFPRRYSWMPLNPLHIPSVVAERTPDKRRRLSLHPSGIDTLSTANMPTCNFVPQSHDCFSELHQPQTSPFKASRSQNVMPAPAELHRVPAARRSKLSTLAHLLRNH